MNWRYVLGYFATPFPSREGFSAYRTPGPIVHTAIIALIVGLGCALCLANPGTKLLVIVWVLGGVYLGRDLAILAHYFAPIALLGLVFIIALPIFPKFFGSAYRSVAAYAEGRPESVVLATLLVAGALVFQVWRVANEHTDD